MGAPDRLTGAGRPRSGDASAEPRGEGPETVSLGTNTASESPKTNTASDGPQAGRGAAMPQVDTAAEQPLGGAAHAAASDYAEGSTGATMAMDAEQLRDALAVAVAERDGYLETAQRIQAEFDNFRKRSASDVEERVNGGLGRMVEALLPVLDACDAAVVQGDATAEAMRGQLLAVLNPRGLKPIEAAGELFDPNLHDAVLHEQGDGGEAVVAEVLRPGYRWNDKVLRAAMVKVRD